MSQGQVILSIASVTMCMSSVAGQVSERLSYLAACRLEGITTHVILGDNLCGVEFRAFVVVSTLHMKLLVTGRGKAGVDCKHERTMAYAGRRRVAGRPEGAFTLRSVFLRRKHRPPRCNEKLELGGTVIVLSEAGTPRKFCPPADAIVLHSNWPSMASLCTARGKHSSICLKPFIMMLRRGCQVEFPT